LNDANIKSKIKLSYAEAFAAGLAKMLDATLLTGDKEFEPLSDKINVELALRNLHRSLNIKN